ncbi:hypothetical protein [Gloeothece verrucosa]|uniref:Uncharacterized protein n=1 Tax=Gloeothece verrucosa (strain PCC 7822) TaxID=497965 RepID=E0UHK7_GLOV7|nr:hypothetical protein [Gloeothece verrucosa]ADN12148.1 conserved hypothetical protein [Gloeothece verrucosa PCC 7822]
MLNQFRTRYPKGCLISELLLIEHGKYIVKALVQVDGITLSTGLAASETLELAEDQARIRALAVLNLDSIPIEKEPEIITPQKGKEASLVTDLNSFESTKIEPTVPEPVQEVELPPIVEPLPPRKRSESSSNGGKKSPAKLTTVTENTDLLTPLATVSESSVVEANGLESLDNQSLSPKTASVEGVAKTSSKAITPPDELLSVTEESVNELSAPDLSPVVETALSLPEEEEMAVETPVTPEVSAASPPPVESKDNSAEPLDFSDIMARSNAQLKRLGWTTEKGRDYLLKTYGKKSRHLLNDEELLEFLNYLESLPS